MGKVDQEVSEALYQLENLIVYQEALGAQPLSSAIMIPASPSGSSSSSLTASPSESSSSSLTVSLSGSSSSSLTASPSGSYSPSLTVSPSGSSSLSLTASPSGSSSLSLTVSPSGSSSLTASPSQTSAPSFSPSGSSSVSVSTVFASLSTFPPVSETASLSRTPSFSAKLTESPSHSPLMSAIIVNLTNQTSELTLKVTDPLGGEVGILIVPPELSSQSNVTLTVTTSNVGLLPAPNQQLGSSVIEVTLVDSDGNSISELNTPLTICFVPSADQKRMQCLSYYDEDKAKWRCEDECLTKTKEGSLCGQTDHLTNFALLFTGAGERNRDPCHSSSDNGQITISWISLGMVCGAIVIVALSILAVELRIRWNSYQLNKELFFSENLSIPPN